MARRQRRGLDELMIVNPSSPGRARAVIVRKTRPADRAPEPGVDVETAGQGHGDEAGRRPRRRFFLGEDGALYELIE